MDNMRRACIHLIASVALAASAGRTLACEQIALGPILAGLTVTNLSADGCNNLAPLTNFGTLANAPGALLSNTSGASLVNAGFARLENRGVLDNQAGAAVHNEGDVDNLVGATLLNRGSWTSDSAGLYPQLGGAFLNNGGTLINAGAMSGVGRTQNTGQIYNLPQATLLQLGPLVNRSTGLVVNATVAGDPLFGGPTTALAVDNDGTVYNLGSMMLTGTNRGVVLNTARVQNSGATDNSGLVLNVGQWATGRINPVSGLLGGSLTNQAGGVVLNVGDFDNLASTQNDGVFINAGTLTNRRSFSVAAGAAVAGDGLYQQFEALAVTRLDGVLAQRAVVIGGGSLLGTGTLAGALALVGDAVLAPAGDAVGALTLQGPLQIAGGRLVSDIATATDFDRLLLQGSADLNGATFEFRFVGDHRPHVGESWEFLHIADGGSVVGLDSAALSVSGLPSDTGLGFALRRGDTGLLLAVVPGALPVPEAPTAAMALCGLLVMGVVAARRRPGAGA